MVSGSVGKSVTGCISDALNGLSRTFTPGPSSWPVSHKSLLNNPTDAILRGRYPVSKLGTRWIMALVSVGWAFGLPVRRQVTEGDALSQEMVKFIAGSRNVTVLLLWSTGQCLSGC